jgi:glycosyltransferase involved in cell wall biosynthesis
VNTPATVAVVVPTRDSMRTLEACLRSIRAQDVPVELIVVDNASTDGTYEVARELADTAVRGGPERSAQRNTGVRLATADWILWIDADMVLPPTTVSAALATAARTGADAVAVPEVSVGPGFWTACRALERSCYLDDPSLHNPRLVRRELLLSDGEFDPAMAGPEDTDLRLRLRSVGTRTALCSDVLIVHDEGRLTLRSVLAKRVYYGRSLPAFAAKNPGALAGQGAGTVTALVRHRRRLARHPARTGGLLVMRAAEAAAYAVGYHQGRRR